MDSAQEEDVRIKYLHSGIPEKVVKMISKLYEDTKACVRIEGVTSKWFKVKIGVRQGCILSHFLFNVSLGHILRKMERLEPFSRDKPKSLQSLVMSL